ncbi:MAG: hypothetical protein DSY43_04500 [Gammaproteobacteria bacterium]|uniref:PepSY domain-containing protein n=1 Tax=endosymbiont of Bathymodiolus septemdierum str. Myojin knoll TaxID=1303921 RepID=A0A0P0UQF5_9GAMM|nr:hypothetical protein [Bathymodiolus septemdierum thioautotrophic gill symbiont]RUA05473.1 MAG: hypothetical protein DSY43_04500 [Gammaproteobacteria bacterium]BAS67330.1 hypothetical protein BSEPE_0316 [endosymbiont of Bathymodiolus septemdierum str. Myojin knoll]
MNNYRYLLIFIIAVFSNAYAFQFKVETVEQFDDLNIVTFTNPEDMRNNPEWNPNLEAPPLTVNEAIQAVKKFTKSLKPIKEIEIRTIPKHKNQWHYLIKVANKSMKSKYNIYMVLMNGKVIPAIIQPQGYK